MALFPQTRKSKMFIWHSTRPIHENGYGFGGLAIVANDLTSAKWMWSLYAKGIGIHKHKAVELEPDYVYDLDSQEEHRVLVFEDSLTKGENNGSKHLPTTNE